MKKMLTKAGGSEEHTVFLFSDTQIKVQPLRQVYIDLPQTAPKCSKSLEHTLTPCSFCFLLCDVYECVIPG